MSDDDSTLTFLTESLPGFKVGQQYQQTIQATGGMAPYTFATTDGNWPGGINMDQYGQVTGTVSEGEDTTVFVTVTDDNGNHVTQAFDCELSHGHG